MFLTARIIPTLQSFLRAPKLHQNAANNKELQGGLFVDLDKSQLNRVENLLSILISNYQDNIILAGNIKKLYLQVEEFSRKALSFESLYQQIPQNLRGYVEMTYDTLNQPNVKFHEALLYRSKYYNDDSQSILLYESNPDSRSFTLSTPRFEAVNGCIINLPFQSLIFDRLFCTRESGISLANMKLLYDDFVPQFSFEKFKDLFTISAYKNIIASKDKKYQIRYFGHACVLIETLDTTILIDPFIGYHNPSSDVSRYTFFDLPESIDYVLITHSHLDHASLESLLQIRYKVKNIVVPHNSSGSLLDPSLKLFLSMCGFKSVIQVDEFDKIDFSHGNILCLPSLGEHGDLSIHSKVSYVVNIHNKSIAFLADSNNISPEMYAVFFKNNQMKIDVVFIGMECEGAPVNWLYGPILINKLSKEQNYSRRLDGSDCKKAISLLKAFNCDQAYVYAMGYEPWVGFISSLSYNEQSKQVVEADRLVQMANEQGIYAKRLFGSQDINL